MKNKSAIRNPKSKIAIVGAGPAGASLAIRLAKNGFEVALVEREKFPRQKLCGEFISPECLAHFKSLGVLEQMIAVGGDWISETIFYSPDGKCVSVPSAWFNADLQGALSISRAEMDLCLVEKARNAGVEVLEETAAIGLVFEGDKVCGVKARTKIGVGKEIFADLTIDATGRANVLAGLAKKSKVPSPKSKVEKLRNPQSAIRNRLVGFKTHLENVNLEKGRCEIYSFRDGYGGLSFVEKNLANHCFLIKAKTVKEFSGDADKILENVIFQNSRARETMKNAKPVYDWLAVSVDGFGAKNLNPAVNLFSVGDASAFIDPFTGSGILMALESAEILADVIYENSFEYEKIAQYYESSHRKKFQKRLLVCSLVRKAAFVPRLAKSLISVLNFSQTARQILTRSTRQTFSIKENKS
jgi:flavin-dependent dehydrogenase